MSPRVRDALPVRTTSVCFAYRALFVVSKNSQSALRRALRTRAALLSVLYADMTRAIPSLFYTVFPPGCDILICCHHGRSFERASKKVGRTQKRDMDLQRCAALVGWMLWT